MENRKGCGDPGLGEYKSFPERKGHIQRSHLLANQESSQKDIKDKNQNRE